VYGCQPDDLCEADDRERADIILAQVLVAADGSQLHGVRDQETKRDDDRPDRHVEAEDGSANVFLTGPGIDVEKRLAYGHDQKEDCEQESSIIPKQTPSNAARCRRHKGQGSSPRAYCMNIDADRTPAVAAHR